MMVKLKIDELRGRYVLQYHAERMAANKDKNTHQQQYFATESIHVLSILSFHFISYYIRPKLYVSIFTGVLLKYCLRVISAIQKSADGRQSDDNEQNQKMGYGKLNNLRSETDIEVGFSALYGQDRAT
ncbi:unnamed protein product [Adineta ricciae]|uniref:Uncharacterized protein n=1 Tax=Adineta ricciae TaxID=249248 RepID=A0A815UI58_ADIRI|nr:unnamed protein product [Adineta ricciae]